MLINSNINYLRAIRPSKQNNGQSSPLMISSFLKFRFPSLHWANKLATTALGHCLFSIVHITFCFVFDAQAFSLHKMILIYSGKKMWIMLHIFFFLFFFASHCIMQLIESFRFSSHHMFPRSYISQTSNGVRFSPFLFPHQCIYFS